MIRITKCEAIRDRGGMFELVATATDGARYVHYSLYKNPMNAVLTALKYNRSGCIDSSEWFSDSPVPVMVKLANVLHEDCVVVDKLKDLLEGKTCMRFQVLVCPAGGSFDVFAETYCGDTETDVAEFLLELMARAL